MLKTGVFWTFDVSGSLLLLFAHQKIIKTYYVLHILGHGSVSRKQPKMFQIIANMVPIWVQDGVMCKAPTNLKAHDQTTVSAAMAHNLHRTHNAHPSSSPQAKGPAAEALAIK